MRSVLRQAGLGRVAYRLLHHPFGVLRDYVRDGGPIERHRTASGRAAMMAAARELPLLSPTGGAPLALHLLTGAGFWEQTAFCLWSFARCSRRSVAPVIYDDGTLSAEHREPLARLFPQIRFVSQTETLERLDSFLPTARFPALRDRWQHYPNIRKLIDVHLGQHGWKLVIDSDLLFFRAPDLIVSWLDRPERPLHAVDTVTSYGYSRPLLDSLASTPLSELVNVGLCGLNSGELDWARLEHVCRTLISREGTHYFLEQALVAMLVAGRACTIAPAADYVTLPQLPEVRECRAVMHHYVAGSKRWYFQENWRKVVPPSA